MAHDRRILMAALQWHLDAGADEAMSDTPVDATAMPVLPVLENPPPTARRVLASAEPAAASQPLIGAPEARAEAVRLAMAATSLEELRQAIAAFDGIGLKKTATSLVFSDGNPKARVMIIGDVPATEDDRLGKPFTGENGQLLDRMFAAIGMSRAAEDAATSLYISNILNWRPPGNRTPTPAEIEVSLPFIERHIQLVKPELLVLSGGVPAKALFATEDGISKLRGRFRTYDFVTPELKTLGGSPVPAIATYHPSHLLKTPGLKKMAWQDLLLIQKTLGKNKG